MSTRGPQRTVTDDELIRTIQAMELPFVTASDVAEEIDTTRQTSHRYLQELVEQGRLQRHKVGASAVIYWIPEN
jgi:DeoR/GlpR family transcriptional regulator of sugar metabolism